MAVSASTAGNIWTSISESRPGAPASEPQPAEGERRCRAHEAAQPAAPMNAIMAVLMNHVQNG